MTLYVTFGHGQPNFPGYVKLVHPSDDLKEAWVWANSVLTEEYGDKWCMAYRKFEDLHTKDASNLVNTFVYSE